MGIKKIKAIAGSYINELPVGEEWYEKRLAACTDCKYNTDNIPEEERTVLQNIRLSAGAARFCSICLCPIDRKCSVKTEQCALSTLTPPQDPRWNRLEVESTTRDGVTVENLSDTTKLSYNNNEYLFDFGITEEKAIECKFKVTRKNGLKILSVKPACGCTVPTINSFNNKSAILTTRISTVGFKQGLNEKTLSINYQDGNTIKEVHIRFRNIVK